jgi:hypothetical protein
MKYYLQPALLAPPPPLEISQQEYDFLRNSREVLEAAFGIEENFDLLVGNYLELEHAALAIATSAVARHLSEYQEMFELRAEMNRRAVNLLSTARLFVDQLPQRFKECGQDGDEAKEWLRDQHASSFEFRFMEALRNHVQHNGSAVHSLGVGNQWTPPTARTRNEFSLNVHTLRRLLELDPTFNPKVLKECPEQVDLLRATRRYLEAFGSVQRDVRLAIAPSVTAARDAFQSAITRYAASSQSSTIALAAFASPDRDPETKVPVFLDWDDVRIKLTKRNGGLMNLSKCVVISESQ